MNRVILLCIAILSLAFNSAWAYETERAKHYERLFSSFTDGQTGRALARIPPEQMANLIKAGNTVVFLDIRTPREQEIFPFGNASTLSYQMSEVFKADNLAHIPKDHTVVVICATGLRAAMITAGLRDIGFSNVQALRGGLTALSSYLTLQTAFAPVEASK